MARNPKKQITTLILDVDGVLTTGQFTYTAQGKFSKTFGAHDNDGIKLMRPHMDICAITADKRGFAITKKRVADDMGIPLHLVSETDRLAWIKEHFDIKSCAYMGDGMFDARIFGHVGYAIAPANAFQLTKDHAHHVTRARSGEGAVAEACWHLAKKFLGGWDMSILDPVVKPNPIKRLKP